MQIHEHSRTPLSRRLRIDMQRQQLQISGQPPVYVRGRHDLPFLAVLLAGGHHSAERAASASKVTAALQVLGLPATSLMAKDWHRILTRLDEALSTLGPASQRLAVDHAPRSKTIGPWWLVLPEGLVIEFHPPLQTGTPWANSAESVRPPRLAHGLLEEDTVRLTGALKRATELMWNGLLEDAVAAYCDDDAWLGEAAELRALRLLRCADTEITLGRHTAARMRLALAASAVRDQPGEVLLRPHLQAVLLRCDYAENPHQHYARVVQTLRPLAQAWCIAPAEVDAAALGERLNLLCLCERRVVEAGMGGTSANGAEISIARMLAAAHGALFCFLLVQNHEKAQYACANLAYAHQRMAAGGNAAHWHLAVEWHALSFGFSEGFQQSENSAWEFIFLGELWLASAEARAAFERADLRAAWRNQDPSSPHFYAGACALADSLNDPRQRAYAWLNRARFAEHAGLAAERDSARAVLAAHLTLHPAVRQLLLDEGYPLHITGVTSVGEPPPPS